MNLQRILAATAALFGILAAFMPRVIPICGPMPNGMPMKCYYAYQGELVIGLLAAAASIGLFVLTSYQARRFAGTMLILLSAAAAALPGPMLIGICKHEHSPCHDTYHWTLVCCFAMAAIGLHAVFSGKKTCSESETC